MLRPAFSSIVPGSRTLRLAFLAAVVLAAAAVVASLPPLPQDPGYHAFADDLPRLGVPNAANVLSNAAFVVAGLLGLRRLAGLGSTPAVRRWRFFFAASLLVGLGSAYYHWSPTVNTLFWDRLPMTLGFAALTACLLAERLGEKAGRLSFIPLLLAGMASVTYWWLTETAGAGDLRPYILVQYLPMAITPLLLLLFPQGPAADRPYWLLLAGYAIAKLLEWQDASLFQLSHYLISGHTLKHLAAATAILLFRPHIRRED